MTVSQKLGVCALLIAGTVALYWPTRQFSFIQYDDKTYVTTNEHLNRGFSVEAVRWAFCEPYASNWHPLTWLSHMLDCELHGLEPGGHHLSNVGLHAANVVLLFLLLETMTGCWGRSALVALLFALHPLNVQSVAWVAERKNLLSTLFWMLTLLAYVRYARRPRWWTYVPVVVWLALGLMAKPMLVTVPFVLLLLDYWPLGRVAESLSENSLPSPGLRGEGLG